MNKIDKEFIKCFGIEKFIELEISNKLQNVATYVCNSWFGIESIPVIITDLQNEDGRYHVNDNYIEISNKDLYNYENLLFTLLHELEHYYQNVYSSSRNTLKAIRWRNELKNYKGINDVSYYINELEIDAYAFAEIFLETEFNIHRKHINDDIQYLIDNYIKSGKILEE